MTTEITQQVMIQQVVYALSRVATHGWTSAVHLDPRGYGIDSDPIDPADWKAVVAFHNHLWENPEMIQHVWDEERIRAASRSYSDFPHIDGPQYRYESPRKRFFWNVCEGAIYVEISRPNGIASSFSVMIDPAMRVRQYETFWKAGSAPNETAYCLLNAGIVPMFHRHYDWVEQFSDALARIPWLAIPAKAWKMAAIKALTRDPDDEYAIVVGRPQEVHARLFVAPSD